MMEYGAATMSRSMVLVSDGPAAEARGTAMARDAGLAVSRAMTVAEAGGAVDGALAADLLFVEVDADAGAAYDALLARVGRLSQGGQAAVVAIRPELIDVTDAALGDAPVTILCAARAGDRLAAVEFALAAAAGPLREDAPDREDRLRAISADLTRIADRLVAAVEPGLGGPAGVPAAPAAQPADEPIGADVYRRILRQRRLREQFLGEGLFSDPAWDMLLDLAAARLEGTLVAVSSLCIAAAVPATTALRWIRALTERGLMVRTPDAEDGRRVHVTLSDDAGNAMAAFVRAAYSNEA